MAASTAQIELIPSCMNAVRLASALTTSSTNAGPTGGGFANAILGFSEITSRLPTGLLCLSFAVVCIWLFAETRVTRAVQIAHLASAPLIRELWRTMPFTGKLFFTVLGVALYKAVLSAAIVVIITCILVIGVILPLEALSKASPLLARALAYPMAGVVWLILLIGGTLAVAAFLSVGLEALAETMTQFDLYTG